MAGLQSDRLAVSVEEAGRLISVPERTIWREIADGRLKSFRSGRRRLIRVSELEAYVERRELAELGITARQPMRRAAQSDRLLPFPSMASGDQATDAASPAAGRGRTARTRKAAVPR